MLLVFAMTRAIDYNDDVQRDAHRCIRNIETYRDIELYGSKGLDWNKSRL